MLALPEWTNTATDCSAECVYIATCEAQAHTCPKCYASGHLYRHGTKASNFRDSPINGTHTRIHAKLQRYRCRACGETFVQPLPGIRHGTRMTDRCAAYIEQQAARDTLQRIAENIGCDHKTVRNITSRTKDATPTAGPKMPKRRPGQKADPAGTPYTRCPSCLGLFTEQEQPKLSTGQQPICTHCDRRHTASHTA